MCKKEQSTFAKLYLTAYNGLQAASWSYVLIKSLSFMFEKQCYKGAFGNIELELGVAQTAGLMEVVHGVTGLVRANPLLTFIQILSRIVVYWGILVAVPESRLQIGLPMLLVAWSIAEITRYLFYGLSLYNACPPILTWCRYSFFIILYPIGVSGELLSIYSALPYVKERGLFSINLPNPYNFSFDYHLVLVITMLIYLPGLPKLYSHMLSQRSKVLYPPKEKQ
ncbi:very-long-chain (3R)-3-hydroxyacyl-CoA dehydratase 1-like isoform X1 [Varroa jacobsoni]|uniref:very-long-chain (3R)-3-hydroxyacyl-CoA dehydratase 1-like isoform X1 n=2 Tax=Varroa jacobsoni TaxID=62625 RepID=UPI000BF279A9|nr:very-long-chain (3R)-3-hydroxyacyl-CoA dehydratase 1-like isoform X1 [Varroa jacobsoni]